MPKAHSATAAASCDGTAGRTLVMPSEDVKFGVVEISGGEVIAAQLKYDAGGLKYVLCGDKDGRCEKKKTMYREDGQAVQVCVDMSRELRKGVLKEPEDLTEVRLSNNRPAPPFRARRGVAGAGPGGVGGAVTAPADVEIEAIISFIKTCRDEAILKMVKKGLNEQLKAVLAGGPQKSYQVKVRNGRKYVYQVWWDPATKKKVMKYYGRNLPDERT